MDRIVADLAAGTQTVVPWTTEEWVAIQAAAVPTKPQLLAQAQARRRSVEIGGITVGGVPVYTDPESQAKLHAARTAAKEDAQYTLDWKAAGGTFVTLDAATIIALADAVRAHVQACFSAERAVATKINNNTYTTFAQVDGAAEWPTV